MNNLQLTRGTFLPTIGQPGWRVQELGDFNGDNRLDILWQRREGNPNEVGGIVVWQMNWQGSNAPTASFRFLQGVGDLNWKVVGASDTNSDGRAEILWYNEQWKTLATWTVATNNTISFTTAELQGSSAWSLDAIFDFDHDGTSDYLWRNKITNANEVWLNKGSTPSRVTIASFPYADWDLVGASRLTNA